MNVANRLHFIDNLRSFIIGLLIVFHAALCYMAYSPDWWYVLNPERSFLFTIIVIVIDVFIMPVMFFCAGYFVYISLRTKGASGFWKDKQFRITIPYVAGVLLIAPPIAYIIYFTRNVPVTLGQFWMGDYWGEMFQQAHYWFLGVLLLFFLIAFLAAKINPELLQKDERAGKPTLPLFIGFILVTTVAFLSMNLIVPLDTWFNHLYILSFQPVRILVLLAYFILGIYAEKHNWFTPQGYRPKLIYWTILFLMSGFCYVSYKITIPESRQVTLLLKSGNAFLFNLFCFSALMSLLAIFQKLFNSGTGIWKNFSDCSYAIYYVHMFIVFGLAYYMIPCQISIFVKYTIVSIAAILLSWGTANIMRRTPLLNKIF